ncbi:MAG: transposase [Elusimicrobia bacterium]|nr:transposase [Elusimicrobiota bacterium]
MARPLRLEFAGAVYHVTARGNERRQIFREKSDYRKLFEILCQVKERYQLIFYAYVFMPNHYHLLVETRGANLTRAMHFIQTLYTIYFNRKYARVGHLFQGRYRALIVDRENYLLELTRYIHLNPLRAGLVHKVENYRMSSSRDYLGMRAGEVVNTDWILSRFSAEKQKAQRMYKQFCMEGRGITWDKIREKIYGQLIVGTKEFTQEIKQRISKVKIDREIPLCRKLKERKSKEEILTLVSNHYGISMDKIFKNKGGPRKMAIYFLRKYTDMRLKILSDIFGGLHYSSITKIVKRLEEKCKIDRRLSNILKRIESKI